jgi:hypothetical protein
MKHYEEHNLTRSVASLSPLSQVPSVDYLPAVASTIASVDLVKKLPVKEPYLDVSHTEIALHKGT